MAPVEAASATCARAYDPLSYIMAQPLSSMQRLELGSAIAAFDGGDNDIARTMSQTKRTMDGALSADPTHNVVPRRLHGHIHGARRGRALERH